jgi:hypothetical protein
MVEAPERGEELIPWCDKGEQAENKKNELTFLKRQPVI